MARDTTNDSMTPLDEQAPLHAKDHNQIKPTFVSSKEDRLAKHAERAEARAAESRALKADQVDIVRRHLRHGTKPTEYDKRILDKKSVFFR